MGGRHAFCSLCSPMETATASVIQLDRFRPRQAHSELIGLYKTVSVESLSELPVCRPLDHSMAYAIDDYVTQKLPVAEIKSALLNGSSIEVHGIYPAHVKPVLEHAGYTDIKILSFSHNKRRKDFNFVRPVVFRAQKDEHDILGFAVTPGRDYVRHYGAIVRHFIASQTSQTEEYLRILRYPEAERNLCEWTKLNTQVVQAGDRVIVGYVEELVKTFAENLNLHPKESFETEYYKSYRFDITGSRVNLVGVKFSFWGNMSALIAQKICQLGAEEVMYVAKLGTLTSEKDLYQKVFSPSKFVTVDYLTIKDVVTTLPNRLLAAFPELDSGFHASVPTVLEEDYRQRQALVMLGANSIDNEISQMASAIDQHNRRELASISFSCLHFATDYLRSNAEKALQTAHDLSNNRSEQAVCLKNQIIQQIAQKLVSYLSNEGAHHER